MAKFDFINSNARKSWLFKSNFAQTFIIMTCVCIGLLIIAGSLLFQGTSVLSGLSQIILAIVLLIESYLLALRYGSVVPSKDNIVDYFSEDLIITLEKLYQEAKKEGVAQIVPEYFFEKAALSVTGRIIFFRLEIPFSQTKVVKQQTTPVFSPEFLPLAQEILSKKKKITIIDLLVLVVQKSESIQNYLSDIKTTENDFIAVANWVNEMEKASEVPKFWQKSFANAGIAEEWSYGYTPVLSQYSRDLSVYFQDPNIVVNIFGHFNKLQEIENVLAKTSKNNCLLVGDPGVGKKTIVNALAAKIAHGDCLGPIKYNRIRQIDVARLISGGDSDDLVQRINNAFVEAVNAGNIIIYIDNFESLLGTGVPGQEEVGGIDASAVLLPFFENSRLRIIASITPENYFKRVRNNPAISASFEKVDVEPASPEDTIGIMLESIGYIEQHYNVFVPYESIKTIVNLADRYIHDIPFPEKALRLIEEAAVELGGKGKLRIISSIEVEKFISRKVNVPIGHAGQKEKEKLLNLENLLHNRVIGQSEAISAVSDALRRVRAGLTAGKRPVGVFLFLGPTGVGKTETAKALAESYYGSEKQMIRLDMSEYQQPDSINRLIGSANNPAGILTNAILANPFSLILLDEIEKADKNVLNLFLQVFEDGRLTDARGRVSDFTNSIIIATSNAGSEYIRENLNLAPAQLKQNLINTLQQKGSFTPEFLNRFDSVIVYKPLTSNELQQVASLMLNDTNKLLAEKKISVIVAPDALTKLVELGNDPQFGARPMRRVIQEKVESLVAKKVLSGEVQEGATLSITAADIM